MKNKDNKIDITKEEFQVIITMCEGMDNYERIFVSVDFELTEDIYKKIMESLEKKGLITLSKSSEKHYGIKGWYGTLTDKAKKEIINNFMYHKDWLQKSWKDAWLNGYAHYYK